ncbi:histidinol dehydrogenase [Thermomicrobium sp. CFH 73360]|uniref:histidinol dehydrogenase n=1 Tax=Thermomicrobium sp. CFH 73360 TaxID=2951987 RepID=UPI0020777820|nr:histidinol dehydrogenase [Thermomicrobium sp. CFH 73360]MCM8747133.1 histidinol dehydrogenase [Thermomicrobium sp. CFH 73360]
MTGVIRLFEDLHAARAFLGRPRQLPSELPNAVRERIRSVFGAELSPLQVVERIITAVREEGDNALRRFTLAFDGIPVEDFRVPEDELVRVAATVPADVLTALRFARDRIEHFHQRTRRRSWIEFDRDGAFGQLVRPVDRVGIYVPGGRAPLPSSLLMTAIPAQLAGVRELIVCTPPGRDGRIAPIVAAAAHLLGIRSVYRLGGAQAIAAMAFGTESIPKVDIVAGPGNLFVVLAKRLVYGEVGIDQLPGPTETLVIADDSAHPALCAADLLAQAEHDPLASAILITTNPGLARATIDEIERQLARLESADIARSALERNGAIVIVPDLEQAFELANLFAPEHLCLSIRDPWRYLDRVRNAGGVFLGETSPEVIGDYTAGPSHVMPTGATARFASPVTVETFLKVTSVIAVSPEALERLGVPAMQLAQAEGLPAHAAAIEQRLERVPPQ